MRKSVFGFSRGLAVFGLVASISLLSLSCGSDSGNCGNPPNLVGSWSGTLADDNAGAGIVGFTFTQTTCSLGGTWTANFASNPGSSIAGSLTGDADGAAVNLQLTTGDASCKLTVSGILQTSTSISGTYSAVACNISGGGTFAIRRQSSPTATPTGTGTPGAEGTATPTATATATPTP